MPIKNLPSFDGIDDGTKKKPENPFGNSGSFGDALSSLFGSIPDMPDLDDLLNLAEDPEEDIDDEEEDEDEVEEETSYTQPQKSKKTASTVDDVYPLSNQLKASILKYSKGRITSDEFKTSLKTNLLVGSISSETVNDFVDNTNFDTNYNSVVKEINNFFTLIAEDFDTNGLQNLEGCESYFTQYANNQDELVNHLTDSINDFVSFIAGCPGCDDFKEDIEDAVKEALDECAGKSTNDIIDEINNSIYVNILNEFELFPDDNADDIDEDEDEDAVFNNTTSNSKQQPKSQLFTDYAMNDLGSRKSTPYTSFGRPFSRKEFLDAFNITEDDLFEKKIAFNKFDSVIPEEFINKFEMATIADQYLNDQNNMHVTFQVVPNFDTNDTLPVWFIIYKDENGSFKCHVSHSCNLVTEDCKPLSFYDVFNKPAVEEVMKGNNPMNNLNNALAGLAQMLGINSPASKAITGPMTEQEAMKCLFKEYLMKEYTDESTHEGKASIEILKTFNHPSLTINELGTIIESDVVKQIGDGYMYVGDLKLNDSEDVKYFLSDFGVTADDGKIELYIRVAYNKIDNDKLPHAKDFVKAIDISRDIFKTNVELYVNRSRNFVYFDFDK